MQNIFYLFIILGTPCYFKKNKIKKYLQMTVLYTKYKAENNAVWTIFVKYDLKIYREVWKFESGKAWNFEMKNV